MILDGFSLLIGVCCGIMISMAIYMFIAVAFVGSVVEIDRRQRAEDKQKRTEEDLEIAKINLDAAQFREQFEEALVGRLADEKKLWMQELCTYEEHRMSPKIPVCGAGTGTGNCHCGTDKPLQSPDEISSIQFYTTNIKPKIHKVGRPKKKK